MQKSITVQGKSIALIDKNETNYISLTDIARYKGDAPDMIIQNWMRNRNTIEFLGLWESINPTIFKPTEFEGFKNEYPEANDMSSSERSQRHNSRSSRQIYRDSQLQISKSNSQNYERLRKMASRKIQNRISR